MGKLKIKTGDTVKVITGDHKGSEGKVLSVFSEKNKAIVEGVNMVKKHQKPNPQLNITGGIISKENLIDASNVAIVNPDTGKADRVGFRFEDGKKVRFFKSNNKLVG